MSLRFAALLLAATLVWIPAGAGDPRPGTEQSSRPARRGESARFHKLLDQEWEWAMREFPEWATNLGDKRYNDRWTDNSWEAIERRKAHRRELLARVEGIRRAKLDADDRLNYDLFLLNTRLSVEGQGFPSDFIQITQMGGVHEDIAGMAQVAPRETVKDIEDFIARLNSVPRCVDQTIALMRMGLDQGIVPPRVVLGDVEENIRAQIVADPADSPIHRFYFAEFRKSIPEGERARLRAAGDAAIRDKVVPAFERLAAFWSTEYYPRTRESIGLSDLPDGANWYAFEVRRQTTTNLTPDQIHELGLKEVARIRAEMERVKSETGFSGTLGEFFHFLRTDPRFFHTERGALLSGYRDICKRADAELPRLFGTLPRLPYGVAPVPEYSEKSQTTAYYMPGSADGGRAGLFYANLYDLGSRPKWEMEALALHEAVPGHHLQISRAQELGELPKFRQHGHYTAYVEGWGLYSEYLGEEMGFYKDPYSKFGQLTYEMWRAIRLVVDTGIHAKGWTRQQAIDFFSSNAGKAAHDIEVEVDRYIVWPGQALAYKIGELKIKELRRMAESRLGERFDVRGFHDTILECGAVPLDVLEARVKDWVEAQARGR